MKSPKGLTMKNLQLNAEINNVICCLEFLAGQALEKKLGNVHSILKQTINSIAETNTPYKKDDVDHSEIINAFMFFAKFCLTEDPAAKMKVLQFIENMDKEEPRVN
jgi:hypothetical protein